MITVINEKTMTMSTYNDFEELEKLNKGYDGHWIHWNYEPSKSVERGIDIEFTTYTELYKLGVMQDCIGFYNDVI